MYEIRDFTRFLKHKSRSKLFWWRKLNYSWHLSKNYFILMLLERISVLIFGNNTYLFLHRCISLSFLTETDIYIYYPLLIKIKWNVLHTLHTTLKVIKN